MNDDDLFDLTGKVAIVTGSTRGIGKAIASRFAQRGAQVVISSRDAAACDAVAEELRDAGGQATGIAAHVGKKEQLESLVAQTLERCGGVDVLVCNAAVNPHYGPLRTIADDAYDRIMNSNVRSALWLANLTFPHMAARGGGAAIFLSSIAGLSGTDVIGAYAVSKTALIGLARSLAVEWGPQGIRVNCLAPGIVKTEFARALWDNPEIADPAVARTALRRLAEPDDVGGPAVFLASRAGAFVTGQTLVIDGGLTINAGV
ncbi:MAG TPA: SDR family oxidoreductase [Candidatus Elarobacter sp.]|nr:SDR family oxidoreductase [Candidatus Elarobacter sp.]